MKPLNTREPISSYQERFKHTPKNHTLKGYWSGKRGESIYIITSACPEAFAILKKFHRKGVRYIKCIPDFRFCCICTVTLTSMSTQRCKNFSDCDKLCAQYWNSICYLNINTWTQSSVAHYRKGHFTWHERNDRIHCDLVPTSIHKSCSHLGGIAECKCAQILK